MMEGPRHQHLHQEWQEPLEEPDRQSRYRDRPPSVYAYMPPPVLRTHTPGDAPRTPASGPRSVFRLFRGCNKCHVDRGRKV